MERTKVTLCPECGKCPSVEIDSNAVRIGEDANMVTLTHEQWNDLVSRVQRGELKQV
ncbi:MAG: hypothetical protein ACREQX_06435 [Candidatus Binataceae bacterium]